MQDWQVQLLSQIKDIRGLDHISWWPMAQGWWYVLATVLVGSVTVLLLSKIIKRYRDKYLWKVEARYLLRRIESNEKRSIKEQVAALSIILRRIAMKKHGREKCAGLQGRAWLRFLTKHDPGGFDWDRDGRLLIEAPYAPENQKTQAIIYKQMFEATQRWVK